MLSGKVIKGINAGNVVFHHRTMQIIARQQTICWQWPFFLSLRDTGISTLANAAVQQQRVWGGKYLVGLGFVFRLCISAGAYPAFGWGWMNWGMGELQDISSGVLPGSALPERHLGQEAVMSPFPSHHCLHPKAGMEESVPACRASPAVPRCDSQLTSVGASSTSVFPSPSWKGKTPQDQSRTFLPDRQGWGLSHISSIFPSAWSHTQSHVPHWTFLGLPVDELTKLLLPPL